MSRAKEKSMYYTLSFYPPLSEELAESIAAIRREHDPTAGFTKPHITVMFPVPESVGEVRLVRHIESVLSHRSPFSIRLGGFHKSHDHWLFLTLAEGEAEAKELYQLLYTGILAEYRRCDIEFVPHLGLGLFLEDGCTYDWDNPQESDFDRGRYGAALQMAKTLPLDESFAVKTLHLTRVPDEVLEWAAGKRENMPKAIQIAEVRIMQQKVWAFFWSPPLGCLTRDVGIRAQGLRSCDRCM
ncbi:MAG: 2'-5' RNA ligase family protein [Candidatus Eisenbacteria bacterium]